MKTSIKQNFLKTWLFSVFIISLLLIACSSKNNPDKFMGTWINNGNDNGLNNGATVEIRSEGGNLIVHVDPKTGGGDLQNTGTCEGGKINVSLPFVGKTQITYSIEDGKPHIYFMGAKLDKL